MDDLVFIRHIVNDKRYDNYTMHDLMMRRKNLINALSFITDKAELLAARYDIALVQWNILQKRPENY